MTVSHFPWLLWPWQLWRLLVKYFVECPLIGVCLMFSFWSMIRLGFCVWGRILQRWSAHPHVVSVVSARLFTAKWPFIPLHIVFLGSESISPALHKGREVKLHLAERGVLTYITGNSSVRRIPNSMFGLWNPGIFKMGTLETMNNHHSCLGQNEDHFLQRVPQSSIFFSSARPPA